MGHRNSFGFVRVGLVVVVLGSIGAMDGEAFKKIRDDKGYWSQVEVYVREHSEAEFSHGICPDCMKALYGRST